MNVIDCLSALGDVILSVNGVSMENVDHETLVSFIRNSGTLLRSLIQLLAVCLSVCLSVSLLSRCQRPY